MKIYKNIKPLPLVVALALTLVSCSSLLNRGHADAAGAMNRTLVRLDRLAASTATGGLVCAKPTTVGTEAKVAVTIPTNSATDYALSATLANWSATGVADASLGSTAWPGLSATAATSVTGKVVTWAAGDLTVGTLYCFQFAGGLTTPNNNTETAAGNVQTQDASSVAIDQGNYSNGIAGNTITSDQIVISNAVVPPTFTFALSGNTDAFPSAFDLTTVRSTAGKTATVTTNAANGYVVWARDLAANNSGGKGSLYSATSASFLVGTSAVGTASRSLAGGTQDYGMSVTVTTNNSATAAPTAAYDGAATKVGTLDPTGYQKIASATTPTTTDVLTLVERAAINASTRAGSDYGDTITVVGAGLF